MDDLSLVLASRELFLSLSTIKAKTLRQAEEHNKLHPNVKIQQLLKDYQTVKATVNKQLNSKSTIEWNSSLLVKFQEDPLRYYFTRPSILEILGGKGSGKTALLLQLALEYHSFNPNARIKILNCAGGITLERLSRLSKLGSEYSDIFGTEDLLETLQKMKGEGKKGLIIIDGMVNLLLGFEKQRIGLGELLLAMRDSGWSIYYSNYVQSKIQVEEKEGINQMGYYSHTFGGIPQCKLTIEQSSNGHSITMIKSLDNKCYRFRSTMTSNGLEGISRAGRK